MAYDVFCILLERPRPKEKVHLGTSMVARRDFP